MKVTTVAQAGPAPALAAARARLGLIGVLFALAALSWWWTADRMTGMDAGPGTPPGALGWFVGVWVVMMAAMMLPSVAPTVALHARMTRTGGGWASAAFTAGYLLTWSAAGVLAYGVFVLGRELAGGELAWDGAGHWVAGGTLLLAGAYELTPLKDACLSKCHSPLGFLLGRWRDGVRGALGMGVRHGAWCLGCCWALMAVAVRARRDEHRGDGVRRGDHRLREDGALASRGDVDDGRRADRAGRAADRRAGGDPGADGAGRRRDGGCPTTRWGCRDRIPGGYPSRPASDRCRLGLLVERPAAERATCPVSDALSEPSRRQRRQRIRVMRTSFLRSAPRSDAARRSGPSCTGQCSRRRGG